VKRLIRMAKASARQTVVEEWGSGNKGTSTVSASSFFELRRWRVPFTGDAEVAVYCDVGTVGCWRGEGLLAGRGGVLWAPFGPHPVSFVDWWS